MWKIERIVKNGKYLYAVVQNHPKANKFGYVLHHRVVMENHLGRVLTDGEVVHHLNHDRKDNRIENLQVMIREDHNRMHTLERGRLKCEMKCPMCRSIFVRERNQTYLQKGGTHTCCSRSCNGKFSRLIQLYGRTNEIEKSISENLIRELAK